MAKIIVPFRAAGSVGIVRDIPPHQIPLNAWSDGRNVAFHHDAVFKSHGYQPAYNSSPPAAPGHFMMPVPTASNYVWLVAGLAKVWKVVGGVWTEITRTSGDYTGSASDRWTGGVLGGIAIISNGVDAPQAWDPATANLVPLDWITGTSTWESLTYSCKAMRMFNNYLVAYDVDYNGARYPFRVQWSHGAVADAVPATWDDLDTTKNAGFYDLVETGDYVIDSKPLRDINIIYKENTTWTMSYIGQPNIFSFRKLPFEQGILARGCVIELNGHHVVKTLDDWIVHDGRSITKSITDRRWRSYLASVIDTTNYNRSYLVPNYGKDEIWFCYPMSGADYATKAVIWNYKSDTLSERDLPSSPYVTHGAVDPDIDDSIAAWTGSWDSQTDIWDKRFYNPMQRELLMSKDGATMRLFQMDATSQEDGANMTAFVERTGLAVSGVDRSGKPVVDPSITKFCDRVWPLIEGTNGGEVTIKIGYQMNRYDAVTWSTSATFTIGTDEYIDCRVNGRYLALRIESSTDIEWECYGFDLRLAKSGER